MFHIVSYNYQYYFVNHQKLEVREVNYSYNNQIIEKDQILWGFKTIWYGRRSRDFKCNPEEINEFLETHTSV